MMSRVRLALLARLSALLLLGGACRVSGTFPCETDEQCRRGGATGACAVGSCAFLDPACASGWRYADSAAEDIAGRCLEGAPPDDCASWQPRHFAACALPAPLGPLRLTGAAFTYDTDTGALIGGAAERHASIVLLQADGTEVRVVSVESFTVEAGVSLRVIGELPLIVAAWGDLAIHGAIDAGSSSGGLYGPGANPAACEAAPAARGADALASGGSGGGGGGGFQGAGGGGGTGEAARAGGASGAASAAPIVRGGCPGASSGAAGPGAMAPSVADAVAAGGAGGGALQLTARGALVIGATGTIFAGGAGGGGAPSGSECGGGGGGSGGMIGLEGASVAILGPIAANGGGGGAGAPRSSSGNPGGNAGSGAAAGGTAAQCAGSGGTGAAAATLAGGDGGAGATCGGGGGGGGAGFVKIRTLQLSGNGVVSPAPTVDPT